VLCKATEKRNAKASPFYVPGMQKPNSLHSGSFHWYVLNVIMSWQIIQN